MIRSLWVTANRDYLPQSFTRRYFFKKHQNEQQDNSLFSVALIDIDFFKKVNDTHGHDVGDQVLIAFANRLEAAF